MVKTEPGPGLIIELSPTQAEMLLFFAGRREDPSGDTRTTGALIARELIAPDSRSRRYVLTALGRQIAAHLYDAVPDGATVAVTRPVLRFKLA